MRTFIAEALETRYRVVTASDGQDGLEKAIRLRPDLILSDVMMPRVGGEQLLAQIRERPEFANVPFILLTARADDGLRVTLLRQGAQDYLLKPFAADKLSARVGNLIAIKRTRDELQDELASRDVDVEKLARAARQAIRARDDFLAVAAHELKTPLTSLLASATWSQILNLAATDRPRRVGAGVDLERLRLAKAERPGDLLDITRLRADRLVLVASHEHGLFFTESAGHSRQ